MIRAMIGTLAVLAGFGVLERSVDASTGQAGTCTATQAYAMLQPGEALPVRLEPSPQSATIGTLSDRSGHALDRTQVTITGSQSGWARIALNTAAGYTDGAAGTQAFGWVPADLLTVDSRVDGPITVYSRPGLLGDKIGSIDNVEMKFRVLGCRGTWLQVVNSSYGNVWIDKWCGREESCRL